MEEPKKPAFRQTPFSRPARGLEYSSSDDRFDRYAYETNAFLLEELSPDTWRVYLGHAEGTEYVDIERSLGKFIRNAIVAQERAHDERYSGHDVPDYLWYRGAFDFPEYQTDGSDEYNDRDEEEKNALDAFEVEEIEGQRPAVSEVMRRLNCHLTVLYALGIVKPVGNNVYPSEAQYDAAEDEYLGIPFSVMVDLAGAEGPPRSPYRESAMLDASLRDIESKIEPMMGRLPIVGRFYTGDPGTFRACQHSFLILGRTASGEIVCFEKMHPDSPPFRLSTLRDITSKYNGAYREKHRGWDFMAGEDLVARFRD